MSTALSTTQPASFVPEPPPRTAKDIREQVQLIQDVMKEVMQEGQHYGVIPGTERKDKDGKDISKKTLLKPGAEKLCLTFRLAPSYWYTGLCAHITRRILPVPKEPLIPLDPLDVADCPACPPPGAPYSSELFDEARAAAQSVWG